MKSLSVYTLILAVALSVLGCEGDYRREAVGGFGEVVVVMDSTDWRESATAEAIRQSFGQMITTLPNNESMFDLSWTGIENNEQLETLKRNRNLIIAAPIDGEGNVSEFVRALLSDDVESRVRSGEAFAFPFEDYWYRDQWSMVLTSTGDSVLAEHIRSSEETLTRNLLEKELERHTEDIYDRGEQTALEDSLLANHGWMIRVQHDWIKNIDTTYTRNGRTQHILTMRRVLPENDRWFWAWWQDGVDSLSHIDQQWINTRRDSLMREWVRGTRPNSWVTTEYRKDNGIKTRPFEFNGDPAWETRGIWRMTNDAMGGPFRTLTVYDEDTDRLFILEFGQFAPKYDKRRFVRQFRAMLRTFRTDSTWNAPDNPMTAN